MNAEIISCGTELLLGQYADTNAVYLSKALSYIGIDVYRRVTVGDNKERLFSAIREGFSKADLLITTGGLGPTVDDITIGTISHITSRDLVFNKSILKDINDYFGKLSLRTPKDALKQALIPRSADWLKNEVGTAPGLIIKHEGKYIIALPGPPRELVPMMEKSVLPFLKKISALPASKGKGEEPSWVIKSKSLRLIGLPEASVNEKVKDILSLSGPTTVGIYTQLGEVELKITAKAHGQKKADNNIKLIENKIRKRLKKFVYGADAETLQEVIGSVIRKRGNSLAIAESCTGGYISSLITDVPGSSKYFIMSLVTYSNNSKISSLGIPRDIIKKEGAVSKNVASLMANRIREISGSDIGLAVTGIAGPSGKTREKPIGLVYIALSAGKKRLVKEFRFAGSRQEIKVQASKQALNLLRLNI